MNLDTNNHSVSKLSYHLVLVIKYHRKFIGKIKNCTIYAIPQLCSECRYKNIDVKSLALRNWTCPKCGTEHDRDINAAKNLEKLIV